MPSMNDSIIYIDKSSPHRSVRLIHLCDKVHLHRMRPDCNVNGRAPVRIALDCNVNGYAPTGSTSDCIVNDYAPVRSTPDCSVNGYAPVRIIPDCSVNGYAPSRNTFDLFEDSVHANQ